MGAGRKLKDSKRLLIYDMCIYIYIKLYPFSFITMQVLISANIKLEISDVQMLF
jgi:hypothetical protein